MQHFSYFAKAYAGALYAGLVYLMSVLAPAATLGSISLLVWIGFAATILGTFIGVAAITNGPKPEKPKDPSGAIATSGNTINIHAASDPQAVAEAVAATANTIA